MCGGGGGVVVTGTSTSETGIVVEGVVVSGAEVALLDGLVVGAAVGVDDKLHADAARPITTVPIPAMVSVRARRTSALFMAEFPLRIWAANLTGLVSDRRDVRPVGRLTTPSAVTVS